MGLDFDQLFPNRFLKAGEFAGKDVTLTLATVKLEELEGDKGKETKAILGFRETKKQLVLNKTNGLCIRGMFGRDTGAWLGKRVTFWPAPIDFGDAEIAIRVRGSPDLAADMDVEVKLARKKARKVRMVRTGPKKNVATGPQQAAPPAPVRQPDPEPVGSGSDPDYFGDAAPPFGEPPDDVVLPVP